MTLSVAPLATAVETSVSANEGTDPSADSSSSGASNVSIADELQKLVDLHNKGALTDAEFQAEMAKRLERLGPNRPDVIVGCPLCNVTPPPATAPTAKPGQQQ